MAFGEFNNSRIPTADDERIKNDGATIWVWPADYNPIVILLCKTRTVWLTEVLDALYFYTLGREEFPVET